MLGYPKIKKAIPWLLGFLEDLTWSGARTALKLLGALEPAAYKDELNNALKTALQSNEIDWVYFISSFIENYQFENYVDAALYKKILTQLKDSNY